MPPVISKLANADNQEQELMPSPALENSNNIPIGDNKLAYIISDIISNLKSQQDQSRIENPKEDTKTPAPSVLNL